MIDAILSFHQNPEGCGVAKFNHALAKRLGVPVMSLDRHPHITPLISVKTSEISESVPDDMKWGIISRWYRTYDLFFHDEPHGLCCHDTIRTARRVYAADETIRRYIVDVIHRDASLAFCPSTINGKADRGSYRVLTFGMAHKTLAPHFSQLKHRLDQEHPDYTIEVSRGAHEGQQVPDLSDLRAIFGDKLRDLGFLADDALAKELREVDAVACYYSPALRANNTTAWAALEAGKTLYTNTDADSPALDASAHSWDRLLELIRA